MALCKAWSWQTFLFPKSTIVEKYDYQIFKEGTKNIGLKNWGNKKPGRGLRGGSAGGSGTHYNWVVVLVGK